MSSGSYDPEIFFGWTWLDLVRLELDSAYAEFFRH